jgi:hypothetical protein
MATTSKIIIGIDDQVIELKGADKDAFIADQQILTNAETLLEAEYKAKQDSRESAIKKLGQASGLTETEIEAILNG